MRSLPVLAPPRRFGQTSRPDAWWVQPAVTFTILASFVVYATWAAFQNAHYTFGPYLSPFYSPELFGASEHAWFGPKPGWWPALLPFSPALLILPFPGLFRFTCYYYRGAYYKAFWADPPNCAVGEPRGKSYWGERWLPLVLQNAHRFFLYVALVFILVLAWDAIKATQFKNELTGSTEFGIGLGTLILTANTVLLAGYTLGCHSLRHLIGGGIDQISKHPARFACYEGCSKLNRGHMKWAWASLISVAFSDLYVRMCSMGIWTDWRLF
jgi:hypothetical protein